MQTREFPFAAPAPTPFAQTVASVEGWLAEGGTLGRLTGRSADELEAIYAQAHGQYGQGRYDEAARLFACVVFHNHLEPRYLYAYAACLQALRRFAEALQYYGMVFVIEPDNPVLKFHVAECMVGMGKLAEARDMLEQVLADCDQPAHATVKKRALALAQLLASRLDGGAAGANPAAAPPPGAAVTDTSKEQ